MKTLFLAAAGLVALPAAADDLTYMESPELCVLYGVTLITGQPAYAATQAELVAELRRRNEACVPAETYMAAASERVRRLDAADALSKQSETEASQRREDRNARIRAAGRAWLQMDQQSRPRTTKCTSFGNTVTCTGD